MRQNNTILVFAYSAVAILAVMLLLAIRFERYLRNSPRWFRAANLVLAITILIWSALGFAIMFDTAHFTARTHAALVHCNWTFGGIAMGILISLGFSRIFKEDKPAQGRT